MKFEQAKQLHNTDEVMIKSTGEVVKVVNTEIKEGLVLVYVNTQSDGYTVLTHKEIE